MNSNELTIARYRTIRDMEVNELTIARYEEMMDRLDNRLDNLPEGDIRTFGLIDRLHRYESTILRIVGENHALYLTLGR